MKTIKRNSKYAWFKKHKFKIAILACLTTIVLIGIFTNSQTKEKSLNLDEKVAIQPTTQDRNYPELKTQNDDYYGWLKIPDTSIDFPVMYKDNTFYLTHNFKLEDDPYGAPFIDERCDIIDRSTNLLIHGHSTMSGPIGKMFDDLSKYRDASFYESHRTISLETMDGEHLYEIMMVIQSKVFYKEEDGYRYYNFIHADNEADYNHQILQLKQISLYNTDVDTQYGDQLITLSTCDPNSENGRLAIIAKEIEK